MIFEGESADAYGHKKLGGIGDLVAEEVKNRSAKFNKGGKKIEVISQKLGYLVRSGEPDAIDSIVPMAYGNLALDLILNNTFGHLVVLREGRYSHLPITTVTATKKFVDVNDQYDTERLRPKYNSFSNKPLFLMGS
jgi:ATP-dependent phosphofructokinase / diphosphate-dependent phosphofructokinase